LKILHFVLGKADKKRANGVNQVVAGLGKHCRLLGAEIKIIGKSNSARTEGELLQQDGFEVWNFTKYSAALKKRLIDEIKWADVVHLHGVYSPLNVQVSKLCLTFNTPYIVSPHGGLAARRKLLKGKLKKTLFHELIQKRHLKNAHLIHALCEEEATEIVRAIGECDISIIPNGVDLDDFPCAKTVRNFGKNKSIKLGYIGRISREKNLYALCEAVSQIRSEYQIELNIVGPVSHESTILDSKWLSKNIKIIGPKYGEDKISFLKEMDVIILPSLSEGMSITALEALATGTPLLATRESNMTYFLNVNSFMMCESTVSGLVRGIEKVLHAKNLPTISHNGRKLIETELNWISISEKMLNLYIGIKKKDVE
jgi:glycosyltransferase involved in cell wall biosynthesis